MAKNDDIKDFVIDVANTIRAKKKVDYKINPQNFSAEIAGITTMTDDVFYGYWEADTSYIKVYDNGTLDYKINDTEHTGLSYTITDDTLSFEYADDSSTTDNIIINQVSLVYADGVLTDSTNNLVYHKEIFVEGGDYDIEVIENEDGTQTLNISDSDTLVDRDATIRGLIEGTLTEVVIPKGTSKINEYGFYKDLTIKTLVIEKDVDNPYINIGERAFSGCNTLQTLYLHRGVESGYEAFNYGGSVKSIYYDGTFNEWCLNSAGAMGSNQVTYILTTLPFYACSSVFYCKNLQDEYEKVTEVIIPNSVVNELNGVAKLVISGYRHLEKASFEENFQATTLHYQFSYCDKLTEIDLSNCINLTHTGTDTFYKCAALTNIVLPVSVTNLGSGAFYQCTSLTEITLPASVTSMDNTVFYGCTSLTEMTILATTPPTLSNVNAISTNTTTIYVPIGTKTAYETATNWSALTTRATNPVTFVEVESE